jgi:nucleotide-binding universal stress UspA family protein
MDFLKRILVPVDFSTHSLGALEYAKKLAEKFNSELILVHVVEPMVFMTDFSLGQISIPAIERELIKKAESEIKKIRDKINDKFRVKTIVKLGKPFIEIVQVARDENIDLIVMGTHGHTGVEQILFGSTAEKVVRKSPCPVLTVRP